MNDREKAIAKCEAIMAEAGLASLIVASDRDGHSYGLKTPPDSRIKMRGASDVEVPRDADKAELEAEMTRLAGLWSGGHLLISSLDSLLRILVPKIQNGRR